MLFELVTGSICRQAVDKIAVPPYRLLPSRVAIVLAWYLSEFRSA